MRALIAGLVLVLLLSTVMAWVKAAPPAALPPRPEQPGPDQFMWNGESLAKYNPMDAKVRATRGATYRFLVVSGCSAGTIPNDLKALELEVQNKLGLSLSRNDSAFDFTVYASCGSEQIRLCGAVNIFCLPFGFPYNVDVAISDILSTYQPVTRLSILLHEIAGHSLQTAGEQYCGTPTTSAGICRGLPRFAPAPGWRDFMNTGPDSRHGFEAIEIERWDRTMYSLQEPRWYAPDGWSYEAARGWWFDPAGQPRFSACNADGLRLDLLDTHWWRIPGQNLGYDYALGRFVVVPVC